MYFPAPRTCARREVAPVPTAEYLFQMAGGVPVVSAPAEIDTTTVSGLRAILFEWQSRGHTTLVMDMTATVFCESAGLRELVWAHQHAVAEGGGVAARHPRRGRLTARVYLDRPGRHYPPLPHLKQALACLPAAANRPGSPPPRGL